MKKRFAFIFFLRRCVASGQHCNLLLTGLLFSSFFVSAQPLLKNDAPVPSGGNTYAIVIGISSYADPDIPKLSFSNKDAIVFADFLQSAAGGSVPKQNIKLLTDTMATIGEVDKSIRWLMNNCTEGDKVFFYFSGHGEMENVTMSKNGYLICYNTPSVAFVNMGLSIDYLNDIVNTISVGTKAKVIVITDACHSGTMAGSKFKGNFFAGEQLMLKKKNEIRMASCKPDELSNESADWGEGRGVFSYYLVNGLQGGLADSNKDQVVSVSELKHYMESAMAKDQVLKTGGEVQTPVIKFEEDLPLAIVVEAEAIKIKEQVKNDSIARVMVASTMPVAGAEDDAEPEDYFFSQLKKQNLEGLTDVFKLNTISAEGIALLLINSIKNSAITQKGKNKLLELESALQNDKEKLSRFNLDIASTFLDIGQNVIANYIRGDEAELERRRYYNSNNNGYDVYTRIFAVAKTLSATDKYYNTKAEVFFHYFSGLALRLKIPLTENPKPLIEQALAEQKKALALEEHAAYIYNELGVLYQYKKMFDEAEMYLQKASQISPGWAIPQSNLSYNNIQKKLYSKALANADKADSLQKDLQSVIVNRGYINEKQTNLLFAEEDYWHAIEINSRHFLPFERLGYVYMKTANYALADSFFYEAALRKKGYHFESNEWEFSPDKQPVTPVWEMFCDIDSSILDKNDLFAFFTWGVQEYRAKKFSNAIRILKRVVQIDKANPLVYHYLGKIYFDQQKWEECELMFKLAIKYAKDQNGFTLYTDSVIAKTAWQYIYDHTCFETFFKESYYPPVEDFYFTGTLYQNWKHFEEAEKVFKMIINLSTYADADGMIKFNRLEGKEAYVKLWRLLENQARYNEAEDVIKNYRNINLKNADEELNEFYRRMIGRFPDIGDWAYRLGTLLYTYAADDTRLPYLDSIVRFPYQNRELFIDFDVYAKLGTSDDFALHDKSETVAGGMVTLENYELRKRRTEYRVPGTKEKIVKADLIYMPRKDGIEYLQKAAALLSEKETLADIHFKTGNIYLWAGSKKQAYPYFEKSLSLVPDNANARLTLVDIYKALYKNRAAFNQLNYLNDSNQVNLPKRILFAQFNIWAGQFDKANQSLNKTEGYAPYTVLEINNLRGLAAMLADKPKQAIEFYKKSINAQETDPWFNYYSLARLYAKAGNTKQAWKYLQDAINMGFNYFFVLQNDSYMENLRKTGKWQNVIGSITMKNYKPTTPVN